MNPEIYTRSYSNDPDVVAEYALQSCRGFQEGGLIATGKHFPGRGDSALDAHYGTPVIAVDRDTLLKRELLPYRVLIQHHLLPSIMIAHTIFPAIDEEHTQAVTAPEVIQLAETVAKKSILLMQDDQKALPFSDQEKILLIEQVNDTPNTFDWHPGVVLKYMEKHSRNVDYLETHYTYDEQDKADIMEAVKNYSVIFLTAFYKRGYLANNEMLDRLIEAYPDKKFVLLTNTPYPISIPQKAKTVFLTLSTGPANIKASVDALFGALKPEGQMPV